MIIGREGKGQGKTPLFSSQIFEEAGDITHITANAKDSEVIKKVHGFWVIQLKN